MQPMAPATSASSKTTQAPFPPSSSNRRFIVAAPDSAIFTPMSVEPVNETMSTSGEDTRVAAAAASWAVTRFTTPGGNPTSSRIRTSSMTARGSWGAGFTTTVFPMARAGATFPAMLTMGKL